MVLIEGVSSSLIISGNKFTENEGKLIILAQSKLEDKVRSNRKNLNENEVLDFKESKINPIFTDLDQTVGKVRSQKRIKNTTINKPDLNEFVNPNKRRLSSNTKIKTLHLLDIEGMQVPRKIRKTPRSKMLKPLKKNLSTKLLRPFQKKKNQNYSYISIVSMQDFSKKEELNQPKQKRKRSLSDSLEKPSYFRKLFGFGLSKKKKVIKGQLSGKQGLKPPQISIRIFENEFCKNMGTCVQMEDSIKNSYIEISTNQFNFNFLSIVCLIIKNNQQIQLKHNNFKISIDNKEKAIKLARQLSSLILTV